MEHVRQLNRVATLDGDEVLDAEVDRTADPDMMAAAVIAEAIVTEPARATATIITLLSCFISNLIFQISSANMAA